MKAKESGVILILELYAFYADLIRLKIKKYKHLTDTEKERKDKSRKRMIRHLSRQFKENFAFCKYDEVKGAFFLKRKQVHKKRRA